MNTDRTVTKTDVLAGLDFTVAVPADWVDVPIPTDVPDFADATAFAPLGVFMAPYGAFVFAVAARPAFADGAVGQWLDHVARVRGLDPGAIETQPVGALTGAACWGLQIDGGTQLRARIAFVEDGERLLNISCMAPAELWAATEAVFVRMLASFRLLAPRGSSVALAPAGESLAACTMGAAAAAPAAARTAQSTGPTAPPASAAPAGPRGPLPLPDGEPTPASAVALAEHMQSFDPEHELNVRMRNSRAGLCPRVLDHHDQERWATLAPAAIVATMRVPFGWHVVDDGRRTLVFDPAGHTQVSMQLFTRDGCSDDEILASKVGELEREWPTMRHVRTAVLGMECLLVRDAVVNGEPIEQAYLLRQGSRGLVLQTRVTSSPAHFAKACDLAEVLLRDLQTFA